MGPRISGSRNADGSDPRQLTDGERENYLSPEWTPDGRYVMATKGTQVWLYHEDGGSGTQVTGHRAEGAPPPAAHFGAAFGSDPRYVWLNLRGNLGGGFNVGATRHADGRLVEPWEEDFGPDHTPRSSARQIGPYQIGVLDRETGRVLVRSHEHEGAFRPLPSPDGRWLVYATRYDAREALKLRDLETGEGAVARDGRPARRFARGWNAGSGRVSRFGLDSRIGRDHHQLRRQDHACGRALG